MVGAGPETCTLGSDQKLARLSLRVRKAATRSTHWGREKVDSDLPAAANVMSSLGLWSD